jgi:hypothetical protein
MSRICVALYSAVLTIGNSIAAVVLSEMAGHMRSQYRGPIGIQHLASGITRLALDIPQLLWIIAAISLLTGLVLLVRKMPVSLILSALLVIGLMDCAALLAFSMGLWDSVYGMYEWTGTE